MLEVLQSSENLIGAGGGGGKGGGGGSVDEQPNTLRSRSILNILYLLSEGEIAGFPTGQDPRKFIYLDDTPIMSSDGTINYKGVSLEFRTGTPTQAVILGSGGFGVANFVAVAQKVAVSTGPVVRLINNPGAAAIRVSLFTPGLRSNSSSAIAGSSVRFKIEISTNGGPWIERVRSSFTGKTSGGYARDYTIRTVGAGPWNVRVTRLDPDSTSDLVTNDLAWQSYTALFAEQYSYPNSALLYMRFDSVYIKSTPKISLKIGGMICWVPSNYNASTRVYTGVWNGLFARAMTDNPAWLLYTSILAERWGTGNRIKAAHIDKWSFYRFGQRCDEMISDGWGGMEPRHTYRSYIRSREDALAGLQNLLVEARAQIYWDGGQIFLVQDRPGIVLAEVFTNANVITKYDSTGRMTEPPFRRNWTAAQAIHTVALVAFYDQNNFGRKDIVRVDSADIGYANDLTIYGELPIEVTLPGTTSRAAAIRHGRWRLITERLEDEVVSFAVGSAGQLRRPGELLAIQDNGRNAEFLGGRVLAATTTSVQLDRQISWALGDQFMMDTPALVSVVATNTGVDSNLLQFAALATAPPVGAVWIVFSRVAPTLIRMIGSADREDNTFAIQGIKHDPTKYAIADAIGNLSLNTSGESMLPVPKPASNLEIRPATATTVGYVPSLIANTYEVGWAPSPDASVRQYILQKSSSGTNYWESIPVPPTYTDVKLVVDASQYIFRVAAVGASGKVSTWVYGYYGDGFQGIITEHLVEGALKLSRSVLLVAGKSYQLEATLYGATVRQNVLTAAGITDEILTTPGWLGAAQYLTAVGSAVVVNYPTLGINNGNVSYIVISGGSADFYQGQNYTGTMTHLVNGVYRADYAQIPNDYFQSAKVTPGTNVFISQYETGYNAPLGTVWRLIEL